MKHNTLALMAKVWKRSRKAIKPNDETMINQVIWLRH